MSFIPRKDVRLYERSLGLRRELLSFVLLLTVWSLLIGLFCNMTFSLFGHVFEEWAKSHFLTASLAIAGALVGLVCVALLALTSGLTGALNEARRFHILLPVMTYKDHVETVPVEGYWITKSIHDRLQKEDSRSLWRQYQEGVRCNAARPFVGTFFQTLANTVSAELLRGLQKSCEFLLSEDAEFHGCDYSGLAEPPGACRKVEVSGAPGAMIRLPKGCGAEVRLAKPDRYGKTTPEITITGPFGQVDFTVWPQWAILSERYNNLSLRFVKERLDTPTTQYSERNIHDLPSLWVLELPVEMRLRLMDRKHAWFFLFPRFELFASWICAFLDRVEEGWSWEKFVDRTYVAPSRAGTSPRASMPED